ncbi:P-loop NTPase fold protein [Clostridium sp.]|uniref:KAP family P-loop NTPase fold protein n=1 Tax=Clostridium sp. TaxID=1506 RepID=UPI002FCC9125
MTDETNSIQEEIKRTKEDIEELKKEIENVVYDIHGGFDEDEDSDEEYEQRSNNPQYILDELERERKRKEKELLKLEADAEIEESNMKFQHKKQRYKKGILVSDNETEDDLLSRKVYSQILAEYIVSRKTDTPFNVGIFGEWGEGKSTFLKLIEQEIRNVDNKQEFGENYKTHIIRYDASEYSEQNKIWSCILKKLFYKFEEEKGIWAKILFSSKRFTKKIKRNSLKYLIMIITVILIIVWGFIFNKNIVSMQEFKKVFVYSYIGIIPLAMGVINIIVPFIKSQIKIAKPLAEMVETNINLPSYTKDLGIRENIKEDLTDLLEVWLKKSKDSKGYNERLVIFVDELDRASEQGILELLDSLQIFLSMKQIVIVIAVNFRSVCDALTNRFEHLNKDNVKESDKIMFALNYLEKYINIPVFLNYEGKYEQYVSKLFFEKSKMDNTKVKSERADSDMSRIVQEEKFVFDVNEMNIINNVLDYINRIRHITPREVKKVVNILVLSKQICMSVNDESSDIEKIQFENYIKWFMFSYFNPITSFNLLKIIDKKEYFDKFKEFRFGNVKGDDIKRVNDKEPIYVDREPFANKMITLLSEIKVNEIRIFKDISNHFIFNENRF